MNYSQQARSNKLHRERVRRPETKPEVFSSPRQSPITEIRALIRLVFESYQLNYSQSSPKVQKRYRRLIDDLAKTKPKEL